MQITPLHLPLLVCVAFSAWLTWLTWRRRTAPGAKAYAILLGAVVGWTAANLGEKSVAGFAPKIFFADLQYIFAAITPAAWYVFVCRYTGRDRLAPRWATIALAAGPVLVAVLTQLDPWLHLMRSSAALDASILGPWGPSTTLAIGYGPAFLIHAIYAYVLFLFGAVALLEFGVRSSPQYRAQVVLLVAAMLVPLSLSIAYVCGFRPLGNFDLTPFGFTVASAVGAWTIVRDRAFDLTPVARDLVLEEMPDSVFVVDEQGRILDANEAGRKLAGRPARTLTGLALADVWPEATKAGRDGLVERSQEGRRRKFTVRRSPLIVGRREAGGLLVFTDVTEQVELEEDRSRLLAAVQNVQKLESLGVLAAGVAHDFNNVLSAILGSASLALEEAEPGSPLRPFLQKIETSAEHAADLTHQLLMYSGRRPSAMQPVQLVELLAGMSDILRWSTSPRTALRMEIDAELPWVQGDPSQLRQVLVNLTSNAADAAKARRGGVRLSLRSEHCDESALGGAYFNGGLAPGEHVVVEVADDGEGMDAPTLRRIFEPFFTTKSEGRGLGLAAVLGIVRGHKGAIFVESSPGRGSSFRIHLEAVAAPPASAGNAGSEAPERGGGGMVLFADGDESMRALAERAFRQFGFRWRMARDAAEALEIFEACAEEVEVVVLDAAAVESDASEWIRRVRRRRPSAAIVVASGRPEEEVRERLQAEPPDGLLRKPYRTAELIGRIREALIRASSSATVDCDAARPSVE